VSPNLLNRCVTTPKRNTGRWGAFCLVAVVAVVAGSAILTPSTAVSANLSGRVSGLNGNDHVLVRAEGPATYQATTRSAGRWSIPEVAPGKYTITPINSRYLFKPAERVIMVGDQPVASIDFLATPDADSDERVDPVIERITPSRRASAVVQGTCVAAQPPPRTSAPTPQPEASPKVNDSPAAPAPALVVGGPQDRTR